MSLARAVSVILYHRCYLHLCCLSFLHLDLTATCPYPCPSSLACISVVVVMLILGTHWHNDCIAVPFGTIIALPYPQAHFHHVCRACLLPGAVPACLLTHLEMGFTAVHPGCSTHSVCLWLQTLQLCPQPAARSGSQTVQVGMYRCKTARRVQ